MSPEEEAEEDDLMFQQVEDDHSRCIIHLDIDCFYAQVEMVSDPSLVDKPLGIQQKNIVVTCNYVARARGVGKCMNVTEALKVCPQLVLVNGEDLARYRKVSMGVYSTLVRESASQVERLGMDENWVDVTRLVQDRLRQSTSDLRQSTSDLRQSTSDLRQSTSDLRQSTSDLRQKNLLGLECRDSCGCQARLETGAVIAEELREKILSEHRLTVSAGISYNKLLSKLSGGLNKPDAQTVLGPAGLQFVLRQEMKVTNIPGLGRRTAELLNTEAILTVGDLRRAPLTQVVRAGLGEDLARTVKELSWGRDSSSVKMSGRVGVIGLEDRFKAIQDKAGVKEKLVWLMGRLGHLLAEDGRQATTLRVTARDYHKDKELKRFHKESRQCKVSARLFLLEEGSLKSSSVQELTDTALSLVGKMVNLSQTFHLTLLGLAFTDFLETTESKASIKRFFSPTKLLQNKEKGGVSTPSPLGKAEEKKNGCKMFNNNPVVKNKRKLFCDEERDERQQKVQKLESKALHRPQDIDEDVWNSIPRRMQEEILQQIPGAPPPSPVRSGPCPSDIDPEVFSQLPPEIQQELRATTKSKQTLPAKAKKTNTIKNYFSVK